MSRAVLSAGSNIGDSVGYLESVIRGVGDDLVAVSQMYRTPPWGGIEQAPFVNITLIADGARDARGWLELCRELESAAQRTRDIRWGPRTLDVDVIAVYEGDRAVVSDDPELTLPHPRAAQRAFVLVPWADIDPEATMWTADGERAVADLISALPPDEIDAVTPVVSGAGDQR